MDHAVALKPEDELPYIARSKCLNRSINKILLYGNSLGFSDLRDLTIIDADKALEFNPYCTKAIVEKGEALFKMGHFENALVH